MIPEDTTAQPGQADSACVAFWAPALQFLLRGDHNKLRTDSTVGVLQKRSPHQEPAAQSSTVGGWDVSVLSPVHILLSPQISLSLKKKNNKNKQRKLVKVDYQLSARCGGLGGGGGGAWMQNSSKRVMINSRRFPFSGDVLQVNRSVVWFFSPSICSGS